MTDITWEEPPVDIPSRRPESKYRPIADELRANEGLWALVTENGWLSLKSQIEAGGLSAFRPRGAFEARAVRGDDPSRGKVYARYIGAPAPLEAELSAAFPDLPETEEIRRLERERVAAALEHHRQHAWNGSPRKVSNFDTAAQFVRSLP